MDLSRLPSETGADKFDDDEDSLMVAAQVNVEESLQFPSEDEEWMLTISDI